MDLVISSNHLPNLILYDGFEDIPAVFLSLQQRLAEFYELVRADIARQRRLVRVYHSLNHCWAVVSKSAPQNVLSFFRPLDRKTCRAAIQGDSGEIDGL